MNYSLYNQKIKHDQFGMPLKSEIIANAGIKLITQLQKPMQKALQASSRFNGIAKIADLAKSASKILNLGNQTGEGWFLTGEMIELLDDNVDNIICMQPFGCLPNHVVGKGVVKELRRQYPKANIAPIDYDPGVSVVNQLNRIRLMLASANKNLAADNEPEDVPISTQGQDLNQSVTAYVKH